MKKFILFAMIMFSSIIASAQITYDSQKLTDNVYVGAGLGASCPLSFNNVFPLNASLNIKVGKNFTPVFGVGIEGSFITCDNFGYDHQECVSGTFVRGTNVGIYSTVNLMNLFCHYNGQPRLFEVQTVAGLGWGHIMNSKISHSDDLTAKTGFNCNFNLGKTKAWTVYIQPAVLWNLTACHPGHVEFNKMGAQLSVQAGVVYHFKNSNGKHYQETYNITDYYDRINELKSELEAAKSAKSAPEEIKVPVKVPFQSTYVAQFAQNSYELSDATKSVLSEISGGSTVSIIASASPEGTSEYNQTLSQKRADAISEYLKGRGITVSESKGIGVSGSESNRIAVITVK